MHSQSKKKRKDRKSQVEKGWAENQDNSGPRITSFHYPFAFERGDLKNLHSHGVRLKDVCLWRLAWKAVSGLKWEMPQLFPIVTLCGLTEACVLIMSTSALFFAPPHTHTRVFNIAFLLSSHTTSAALSSAVPEKKIWWRARRMTRNNGAINSHLCFLRWPCHRRLRGSEVRQAKCQQHSATRCTSSHSADLKSVASIWGKAEKKHARVLLLLLRCTCAAVPYFYHRDCLQFFTKMEVN